MEANNESSTSNKEVIATNVQGTVKWFHRVKGFGFVTREDTQEDIFVHYTSLKPNTFDLKSVKKRLNLLDKEKIHFDVVKSSHGLEAVNIHGKTGYYILDIIAYKRDIPAIDLEIVNDSRISGKVKWFNVKKKYGFIHCDFNNEDVFVHASSIIKNNPNKYKASLDENELVEFDILKRADGKLEAVNVTGPKGQFVQGSQYSPDKNNTSNDFSEQEILGKVKWFNVKAGFGFITRSDNGQDVYAHYTAITKKNPNHRVRSLADGEVVRFNIKSGSKGAEACDITAANGGPVQGSEYALPLKEKRGDNSVEQPHQQQAANFPINNNSRFGGNSSNRNMMSRRNRFPSNSRGVPSAPRTARSYQGNMNNFRGGRVPRTNTRPVYDSSRQQMHAQVPMPPQQPPMMRYPKVNSFIPNQNMNFSNNQQQQPAFGGMYSTMNQMPSNGNYNQPTQHAPTGTLVERRVQGSVKWYNYKNGFGFIVRNDNKQDIFVHNSGLQYHKMGLDDGEPVEFDVLKTTDRLLAVNVTGPNGNNLRGSKYAYNNNSANMNNNAQPNRYNNAAPTSYRRRRN